MTELPDGEMVLRRSVPVAIALGSEQLQIRIPDALSFLTMKVRAKKEQRPTASKDSFDIYAYVQMHGVQAISAELKRAGEKGHLLIGELRTLFWNAEAPGVLDVLSSVSMVEPEERALLVQGVVDLFDEL